MTHAPVEELTLRKPTARAGTQRTTAPPLPQRAHARATPTFAKTVTSLAVAITEVLHGQRSHTSIARWLTPELAEKVRSYAHVRQNLARAQAKVWTFTPAERPRICVIDPKTAEATVVIHSEQRSRAVAMRLERNRSRWLITELVTI